MHSPFSIPFECVCLQLHVSIILIKNLTRREQCQICLSIAEARIGFGGVQPDACL